MGQVHDHLGPLYCMQYYHSNFHIDLRTYFGLLYFKIRRRIKYIILLNLSSEFDHFFVILLCLSFIHPSIALSCKCFGIFIYCTIPSKSLMISLCSIPEF